MDRTSTIEHICDLITLIRKKPRTQKEIANLWGLTRVTSSVAKYFKHLHDEGLIYVCEHRQVGTRGGARSRVYAWQPEPFLLDDAADHRATDVMQAALIERELRP